MSLIPRSRYLGTLGDSWKTLPRLRLDMDGGKRLVGMHLAFMLIVSTNIITSKLPKEVMKDNKQTVASKYPIYRAIFTGLRLKKIFKPLMKKMFTLMPFRYTDAPYVLVPRDDELGGNINGQNSVGSNKVQEHGHMMEAARL